MFAKVAKNVYYTDAYVLLYEDEDDSQSGRWVFNKETKKIIHQNDGKNCYPFPDADYKCSCGHSLSNMERLMINIL